MLSLQAFLWLYLIFILAFKEISTKAKSAKIGH
jgi:hypothetical protein